MASPSAARDLQAIGRLCSHEDNPAPEVKHSPVDTQTTPLLRGVSSYEPVDDNRQPQEEQEKESSLLQSWHPYIGDHGQERGKHSKSNEERCSMNALPLCRLPKTP